MFCENCGQQMPDNAQICPNCGAFKMITTQSSSQNNTTPEKKSSGNVGKIVAICVCAFLLIAAVIIGVFIIKDTLDNGPVASDSDENSSDSEGGDSQNADGENGGGNGGGNQNVSGSSNLNVLSDAYTDALSDVEKDSNQYHVLNIVASLQNLLFDSESFEMDFEFDDYISVDAKLMFGTDIESTNIMVTVTDEYDNEDFMHALLNEGIFEANAYGEGIEIDVCEILKDTDTFEDKFFVWTDEMVQSEKDDIQNSKDEFEEAKKSGEHYEDEYGNSYYIYNDIYYYEYNNNFEYRENNISVLEELFEEYKAAFDSVDKAVNSLFSGNRLNYNSVSVVFDKVAVPYLKRAWAMPRYINNVDFPTFDEIWEILYDFIANGLGDDDIKIEVSKDSDNDSVVTYNVEFDIVAFLNSLYDYASGNEKIRGIFGDLADEYFSEMEEELDYLNANNYMDVYNVTIETQDNYLTLFEINMDDIDDMIKLEVENINSTTISESEYSRIRTKISSAPDGFYTINDMDELLDMLGA